MGEIAAGLGEGAEIGKGLHGGDAREFFAEVIGVAGAVVGGMQQAVDVVEEVFFGDATTFARCGIGGLEMGKSGIGDGIAAGVAFGVGLAGKEVAVCGAGFGFFVEVEGEALATRHYVETRNIAHDKQRK